MNKVPGISAEKPIDYDLRGRKEANRLLAMQERELQIRGNDHK